MIVAGVDAARSGWLAVTLDRGKFEQRLWRQDFGAVLEELSEACAIGVDIPIGEPPRYPREADVEARRFVGERRSSVFPTPHRSTLCAATYADALAISRAVSGKGLSRQSFGLRHRIVEVEAFALTDDRIFEAHPEVSFRELAGRGLGPKRSAAGARARLEALARAGIELSPPIDDDLLDAAVAAWTAARYARGEALPLPAGHRQRLGAIWY